MAIQRTLHQLRLLISGEFHVRQDYSNHNRVQQYYWKCGCIAIGTDVSELDVRHCNSHHSAFDASYGSTYYRT